MEEDNKTLKPEEKEFTSPINKKLDRREFLRLTERGAGLLVGASLLGPLSFFGCGQAATPSASGQLSANSETYPFKLGVASGEPLPDGVVLWTRLAPAPLTNGGHAPAASERSLGGF
ncbi:MAG: PhoD-like phosphatase N-terminal domain-containing protein [Rufibacter sp.]